MSELNEINKLGSGEEIDKGAFTKNEFELPKLSGSEESGSESEEKFINKIQAF